MGQGKVPAYTVLAIKRILDEYTGGPAVTGPDGRPHEARLSVTEIRQLLAEVYDIHVGDDYLRRTALPAIDEFYGLRCPRDHREYDTPCLFPPNEEFELQGRTNAKKSAALSSRAFLDYEVDFISDAIESSVFMSTRSSSDLVRRIRALHSPAGRERDVSAVGNLEDEYRRAREASTVGATAPKGVKPGIEDFEYNLELVKEALYDPEDAQPATISFDVARYRVRPGNTCEIERSVTGLERHEHLTVYRLMYMNGHYFVLCSKPGARRRRDEFSTYRVDLMENLEVDDPQTSKEHYRTLRDEKAPDRYMRGAIEGFCGKLETVKIRCNAHAFHYVAERYSDFPNFRVVRKLTGDPDDPSSQQSRKQAWYEVEFDCATRGFEQWSMKFLEDIEILSPERSRQRVIAQLQRNAYGLSVGEPEEQKD